MRTNLKYNLKIKSPADLEGIIDAINIEIKEGNFEILYQRGIFDNSWDDFVEGIYFNFSDRRIYRLMCETYHGSGGEWGELVINLKELHVIYEDLQRYTFWNWESKLFLLSSLSRMDGIMYLLNANEVSGYFREGKDYLSNLYQQVVSNSIDRSRCLNLQIE